jgi:hypothetical protein
VAIVGMTDASPGAVAQSAEYNKLIDNIVDLDARLGPVVASPNVDERLDVLEAATGSAPWVAFTPGWESDGTDPVLGNGTKVGRYRVDGKTMDVIIHVKMGSTTTYGTGSWYFVMNFPAVTITNLTWIGQVFSNDAVGGSPPYKNEACIVDSGTSSYVLRCVNGGGSYYSATVPQTWATNDYLILRATVEIV